MDSGAHFHKCDLQVHTPRDINWDGDRPVTEEDRQAYARAFIAACRSKALDAVAITDHHDIAFVKYIQEAAEAETDDDGKPLPPESRVIVFPGVELTLGIPCQALLIFDADIPPAFLPSALAALGISPNDPSEPQHGPTTKLNIMSFESLYEKLNDLDPIRGRFIVFPHIADGGYKTLLRKDFEKHYIAMPCVGGYVDGDLPVEPKSSGMRAITSGKDKNWGNKPLGLFQTSDSRSRDFSKLGTSVTWVKWARPTAEALRQACLARHSRIAHTEPSLPAIRVTRIEVTNSKFLGPITLDLNPQYNAVIGGRGTGKSTILEYLRWALCDQPPSNSEESGDVAEFQRRRQSLIEGTLLPLDAVVDVFFLLNEVPHIVRRKASGELSLKIGDAAFQPCTEHNVRELLPVRAYSQKQLSAVGARLDELRRFVHAPIQRDLDSIAERIASLAGEMRVAFDRVVRHRSLQAEIAAHDIERRSIVEQIEKLRKTLKGLSPEDQQIVARQASYSAEHRFVQALDRDAEVARKALSAAIAELAQIPAPTDQSALGENRELLVLGYETLKQWIGKATETLNSLQDVFVEPIEGKALGEFFGATAQWRKLREAHVAQYEQAKARAAAHEETLRQIQHLEARLVEINEAGDSKSQQLARLGNPQADFDALRSEWKASHRSRGDTIEKQCDDLTSASRGKLRATLRRAADILPLSEKLRASIKGTKVRGERIDHLIEQISKANDPIEAWHTVLNEILALAWLNVEDEATTTLPATPRLDGANFSQKEKFALARQMQPAAWLDLLLYDLKDLPVFEYQVRTNDFLPFESASPGQQATALLSILLLQDGPPLVIDQPEDDLNMKVINEIVETLWQAKGHRQLIFASHNANLVVNGDAELIMCCDYRTSATESGGQIKRSGAIDVPEINREIAEVMEGGVEAFKLRQQKYGF